MSDTQMPELNVPPDFDPPSAAPIAAAAVPMHAPLQYATDLLLKRSGVEGGLAELLGDAVANGTGATVVTADIAIRTDGVIVVDRRTVSRWIEAADVV